MLAVLAADETLTSEEGQRLRESLFARHEEQQHGMAPLLIAQADVARLLGVSRWTVRRMADEGLLKPVRLRGLTRYRRADVEALVAGF